MLSKEKTIILNARCTNDGQLQAPTSQEVQASRATRLVDDPRRFLLVSHSSKINEGTLHSTLSRWMSEDIQLDGQRYKFLGFTENHVKEGRMLFFREDRSWTVGRLLEHFGAGLQTVYLESGYGKYAARLGLSFSSTAESLDVPDNCAIRIPSWKALDGSDHSDGCGMIRDSFARLVCERNGLPQDTPVFQIRRGGIKGLLVRYPDEKFDTLCAKAGCVKGGLIAYRDTMLKYTGGPTVLELNDYARCPSAARLNVSFILLLLTLGIKPEIFERLLQDQLDLIGSILHDREKAQRYIQGELDAGGDGFAQDLFEMLLAKHDLKEPYVEWRLKQYQRFQYDSLREKLNLRVEDSCYVYGVVDEDGILEEDEVFINLPARTGVVVRDVLVARNPAYSAGDLRRFRAVHCEALAHHSYCIVFSRRAAHSVPDTMSSGDLDGDTYFVTWDPALIPERTSPPQKRPPAGVSAQSSAQARRRSSRLATDMKSAALSTFIQHRHNTLLGMMVNEWKRTAQASPQLANAPYAQDLVRLIEAAHDMLKTGTNPATLSSQFNALRKKKRPLPPFTSPLDQLRELVPQSASEKVTRFQCDPTLILREENEDRWKQYTAEAATVLRQFNRELSVAIKLDEPASAYNGEETAIPSRYKVKPVKHSEQVSQKYRERYFGGGTEYEHYLQVFRASAWYAYGYSQGKQAFAWLGGRLLNRIRAHRTNGGKPAIYIGNDNLSTSDSSSSTSSTQATWQTYATKPTERGLAQDLFPTPVSAHPRPKGPVATEVGSCCGYLTHDWSVDTASKTTRTYVCENCLAEVTEHVKGDFWVASSSDPLDPIPPRPMDVCPPEPRYASPASSGWETPPQPPPAAQVHMTGKNPAADNSCASGTLQRASSEVTLVDDSDEAMSVVEGPESESAPDVPDLVPNGEHFRRSPSRTVRPSASPSRGGAGAAGRVRTLSGSGSDPQLPVPRRRLPSARLAAAAQPPSEDEDFCSGCGEPYPERMFVHADPKPREPVATLGIPHCKRGGHEWKIWANSTCRHYTCKLCGIVCKERHSREPGVAAFWEPYG